MVEVSPDHGVSVDTRPEVDVVDLHGVLGEQKPKNEYTYHENSSQVGHTSNSCPAYYSNGSARGTRLRRALTDLANHNLFRLRKPPLGKPP